ncbi:MAG TPA: hypothetical protein V6C58_11880 [Allocoleopsis sp.]
MASFDDLSKQWQNNLGTGNFLTDYNKQSQRYDQSANSMNTQDRFNEWERLSREGTNYYLQKQLGMNKDWDSVTLDELRKDPRVDPTVLDIVKQRDVNRNFRNMTQSVPQLQQNMGNVQQQATSFRNQFALSNQQPFSPSIKLGNYY